MKERVKSQRGHTSVVEMFGSSKTTTQSLSVAIDWTWTATATATVTSGGGSLTTARGVDGGGGINNSIHRWSGCGSTTITKRFVDAIVVVVGGREGRRLRELVGDLVEVTIGVEQ